jgi:hypothetical protein
MPLESIISNIVIDIESNGLHNPTKIWVIVCKDIDTGKYHIFRNLNENESERLRFIRFTETITKLIGHNLLGMITLSLTNLLITLAIVSQIYQSTP